MDHSIFSQLLTFFNSAHCFLLYFLFYKIITLSEKSSRIFILEFFAVPIFLCDIFQVSQEGELREPTLRCCLFRFFIYFSLLHGPYINVMFAIRSTNFTFCMRLVVLILALHVKRSCFRYNFDDLLLLN